MSALSGAKAITAAVAPSARIAMPAISQKPERVSNILRSSTRTRRESGIGAGGVRGPVCCSTIVASGSLTSRVSDVGDEAVLMLLLLRAGCRR